MGYWFKRRRYGYGWTPTTAAGWILTGIYVFVVVSGIPIISLLAHTNNIAVLGSTLLVVAATAVYILITIQHSPKPRWRWGKRPDDNPDNDW